MIPFLLSVLNAVQPFVGWIVSALVVVLIVVLIRYGGMVLLTVNAGWVKGAAGVSVVIGWSQTKSIQIGIATLLITITLRQGNYLVIPASQVAEMPAPQNVAVAPSASPAPPTGA